jgi:hypothetical protein
MNVVVSDKPMSTLMTMAQSSEENRISPKNMDNSENPGSDNTQLNSHQKQIYFLN